MRTGLPSPTVSGRLRYWCPGLKLFTDDSPIEIEVGNKDSSPGAVSDIQNIGFNLTEEDPTGNLHGHGHTSDRYPGRELESEPDHRAGRPDPERCRDL